MPRKKIEKTLKSISEQDICINKLIDRVNTIDKDIVTIARKQNIMIKKYNGMAEQVNTCKEVLQKLINIIPQKGDKPKDIIVP